jgi:hypothetical protein
VRSLWNRNAGYGTETPVMEQKRRLWNKSDLYGTKATVMEQKRRFMEQKVHLWNRSASLSTLWNKQRNLWREKNTSPKMQELLLVMKLMVMKKQN